jgi:hypothetical protein
MKTFQGGKNRKLQCVITFAGSYKINGNNTAGEWETIEYKTVKVHVKKHCGVFVQPFLQRKSNILSAYL